MDTGHTPTKTTPKLFARQATGLVRAVPQRASLIFNFIPSHPAFVLSAGVFFAFSLFPGGNFILAGSFVWWLYLHYPQFGVSNKANMFEWVFGVVAAALIFYYLVRWILRARRGVKLELVYAEIPPE